MGYTKRTIRNFERHFEESKKLNDYTYQKINYYNEESFTHYILLEFYLRIDDFKELYDECYKHIEKDFRTSKKFTLGGYKELNDKASKFSKYGYDIFDITLHIYQELCIKNIINPKNMYTTDSGFISTNIFYENSTLSIATKDKLQIKYDSFEQEIYEKDGSGYTKEFNEFYKKFEIYKFNYNAPINKHFIEKNSINLNFFLSPSDKDNTYQIEHLYKLIKDLNKDNNDEIKTFCKLSKIDIITYFYVYDLNIKNIKSSKIKEHTQKYMESIDIDEFIDKHELIDRIKQTHEKIEMMSNILVTIKSKISNYSQNKSNKTTDIIDILKDFNDLINIILDIKFICYNQLNGIDDFILRYQNIINVINKIYDKLQANNDIEYIDKTQNNEDSISDNYQRIYFDTIESDFNKIFSSFNYDSEIKKIKILNKHIETLEKNYKNNIEAFKDKFKNIKRVTIDKYINTMKNIVKNFDII